MTTKMHERGPSEAGDGRCILMRQNAMSFSTQVPCPERTVHCGLLFCTSFVKSIVTVIATISLVAISGATFSNDTLDCIAFACGGFVFSSTFVTLGLAIFGIMAWQYRIGIVCEHVSVILLGYEFTMLIRNRPGIGASELITVSMLVMAVAVPLVMVRWRRGWRIAMDPSLEVDSRMKKYYLIGQLIAVSTPIVVQWTIGKKPVNIDFDSRLVVLLVAMTGQSALLIVVVSVLMSGTISLLRKFMVVTLTMLPWLGVILFAIALTGPGNLILMTIMLFSYPIGVLLPLLASIAISRRTSRSEWQS